MKLSKSNLLFTKLSKRTKTKELILHCTATPEGKDYTIELIHLMHKARGWSGCGYHFVIMRDGTICTGRPENCIGSHCLGHNSYSIGIAYVGGVKEDGKTPCDTRTIELKKSMYELVFFLGNKYNLKLDDIHCHNEFAAKACPSFNIKKFKEEYLNQL